MTHVVLETEVLFSQLADLSFLAHQLLGRATHCQLSRTHCQVVTNSMNSHVHNCMVHVPVPVLQIAFVKPNVAILSAFLPV